MTVPLGQREQVLGVLLQHYPDWLDSSSGHWGDAAGQPGSRVLCADEELDRLGYPAFREVDRVLELAKSRGRLELVRYRRLGGPTDGQLEDCLLRLAMWNTIEWFVPSAYAMRPVWRRGRDGKRFQALAPVPDRHPGCREDRAVAGLRWLEARFRWQKAWPGVYRLFKSGVIPGLELPGQKEAA